jgi:fibronectin type 3 domain-containing protein
MKGVSGGQSADESGRLSCTRRTGRGIRRTLAGMFLAAIMLGWPLMTAAGRAAGVPAVIATSNANQISERIAADPPSAPIGLTAKAGDAQVTLSWTPPESDGGAAIVGYLIYQGTSPGHESSTPVPSSDITGCTDTATAGSCTVTALADGTAYYFMVAAENDLEAVGPMSNEASTTPVAPIEPAAPTGLTAKAGDTQVTLSWAAPAPNGGPPVTSYDIYDGTTPDFQAATLAENSPGTAATVPGLTDGTTYYFWVTAVNTAGQSPASNQASATPAAPSASPASNQASATPATTPASPGSSQASATPATVQPDSGAPTGLTASPGDTQVTLSWAAPAPDGGPQVTGYDVYRATTADFKAATLAGTSASTSATVTGLTDGTTYYFWVTAVNTAGHESPSSAAVSARPETASGSVPKGLVAALAAIATVVVAGALTLAMRGRRVNSRSSRHVTPASDVRAVPGPRLPDAVNVRETGREPTHTVRFEPDRGTTTTMIKEKP